MQYSQEHLKTIVYAEFGGQTECIMGNWKIENRQFCLYGFLQYDWSRQDQNKKNLAERNWGDLNFVHGNVHGGHIAT